MCTLKAFMLIGCLFSIALARPEVDPTTTAAPAATTPTPSPKYLACLKFCPTTSEYNPVCGSDTVTYQNYGHLRCAQSCGQIVAKISMGTCEPLRDLPVM